MKLDRDVVFQQPESQRLSKSVIITGDYNVTIPVGCDWLMPVRVHRFMKEMSISAYDPQLGYGHTVFCVYEIPARIDNSPPLAIRRRISPPQNPAHLRDSPELLERLRM